MIGPLTVIADADSDRLTLRGVLPGITSRAGFNFATRYYDNTEDLPDDFVASGITDISTPLAEAGQAARET